MQQNAETKLWDVSLQSAGASDGGGGRTRAGDGDGDNVGGSSSVHALYVLEQDDGANQSGVRGNDAPFCGRGTWLRTFSGRIVADQRFERTVISLIAANAITMGLATFDFITDYPGRDTAFEIVDRTFLVIFTVEIGLQLLHHGSGIFEKGSLVFDALVVILSWPFSSLQIFRAIRIIRALRLVTRIRGLRSLVSAVFNVFPKMFAVGLLILLVFYIYAVLFTELFKSLYESGLTSEDWFSRLDTTMFTLFQMMTLDDWSLITKEVMSVYEWAWLPIITFIMFSSFIVVNLMIAVICDAVAMVEVEKVEEQLELKIEKISSNEHDAFMILETKIDDLTRKVHLLLESQKSLEQELRRLDQKKNQDC